jgi:hypothetical protein
MWSQEKYKTAVVWETDFSLFSSLSVFSFDCFHVMTEALFSFASLGKFQEH